MKNGYIAPVTATHIARARELRRQNVAWEKIGRELGFASETIRRHVDSAFHERRNRQAAIHAFRKKQQQEPAIDRRGINIVNHRPSPELLAAAIARANAPRSLSAHLFGDPPEGYSALDRMGRS